MARSAEGPTLIVAVGLLIMHPLGQAAVGGCGAELVVAGVVSVRSRR